jgi:pimeloyl-ACP methyl ester carboxylesterase
MLGKRVVTVVGAVIWRYANKRDHGVYLTIVEEIMRAFYVRAAGRFLWTEMKDAVGRAFTQDSDHGGTALIEQMRQLWKVGKPRITLVGHSAGSIYVARLLKELHTAMEADFKANVVLIAPACTFDYLADSLESAGDRVASLRIFGMSDLVERNDHLVPGIYPASLLYFVSGVLEDVRDEPLVGMQRYYSDLYDGSKFKTIAGVKTFRHLLEEHAYAWAQTGGFKGANCDMVRHGGWADAPETLASVLYLIGEGGSNA